MENKEHEEILFIESKVIGCLSLILFIFLLYKKSTSKEDKTLLLFKLKMELIISCMIYPIALIFPLRKTSNSHFCKFQTFLLTFSNYSGLMFTTAIPFQTYIILKNPLVVDNNPLLSIIITSLICWGTGLILSIIFICFFEVNFSEYICWYDGIAAYFSTGINVGIMVVFIIITFILKRKIQKFIDEYQLDHTENQFKIFNKLFYLLALAMITILLAEINNDWFLYLNTTLYYFFEVLILAVDSTFYVFVSYAFCFHREMLSCLYHQSEKQSILRNSEQSILLTDDKNTLN